MSDPLPLLDLTYRADLGILVGRWDHQPDPGGLPADEQLATGTRAANSRFWLQDIRRRTLNDPAITAWLLAVYLSDMARCLGPRPCVAYLTSPDLHQAIREAPGSVGAYEDRSFAVASFGDEGAAVTWLHAQQRSQDMVAAPPLGEAR